MDFVKLFIIPLSLAILGYLVKQVFEIILQTREKRFQLYERQLSEFFWPIYIRLHNNNAVWMRILSKGELYDKLENSIAQSIENNVIVQNYKEIEDILKTSIHIAFPDKELIVSIKDFLKHVEIYKALKDAGADDIFPADLKAGYPEKFTKLISTRTFSLQEKLNKVYKIKQ